jgi:hypothetical protein
VALQGTLDTFALPDVLRLLAATKKTGRLRLTGGRGTGSTWVVAGEVVAVEAPHAPLATAAVDATFELLRFEEGAFTFDAEAAHDDPGTPTDVEVLLAESEALLAEWRSIEAVVPSMDAWVTLRATLPTPEITVDQAQWTTLVAVGSGTTVRRLGEELTLPELPISRAVKDLTEAGLVDIATAPPAGATSLTPPAARPLIAPKDVVDEAPPALVPPGPRARRARGAAIAPQDPEVFVPLDLPGVPSSSSAEPSDLEPGAERSVDMDDLAAAFPGLANRATPAPGSEEEEIAKQLATLSPRAASAIRAAAEATTDEEREAALDAVDGEDEPLNRGLLLKFLSSVKT